MSVTDRFKEQQKQAERRRKAKDREAIEDEEEISELERLELYHQKVQSMRKQKEREALEEARRNKNVDELKELERVALVQWAQLEAYRRAIETRNISLSFDEVKTSYDIFSVKSYVPENEEACKLLLDSLESKGYIKLATYEDTGEPYIVPSFLLIQSLNNWAMETTALSRQERKQSDGFEVNLSMGSGMVTPRVIRERPWRLEVR